MSAPLSEASGNSDTVDQVDREVEEGEQHDRDRNREGVGYRAPASGEDVGEDEHTSIMRPTSSSPHEDRGSTHTDFVKVKSAHRTGPDGGARCG